MSTALGSDRRTSSAAPGRSGRWPVVALAVATAVLRVPALLADRHLTVDDGVFGASAVAMREGDAPFRSVFSSQGPLFLPLVWLGDLVGLRQLDSPRVLALVSGVVLVLAVFAAGREVAERSGALLAAALVAVTGSVLWVTGPIAADGPALALATVAVALALGYRRSPTSGRAVAVGLAMGAALSVKSLLVPAAVPVGLVLLAGRRPRHLALAVGASVLLALAVSLPWGLADVWDQSVDYHLDAASDRTPGANAAKVASTLVDRDLPLVVVAALAAGAALLARGPGRRRRLGPTDDVVLLGVWLLASLAVLLYEYPMWRPHVAFLAPPLALLVARRPPPWPAMAVAAVLVLPAHVLRVDGVLWPDPYDRAAAAVTAELAALPEGALAISDEPGLVWRAGRRTPPDLVDASRLRIDSGRITAASLASAAAADDVCAVAVWDDRFAGLDGLPERLSAAGYDVAARYGGVRTLYRRPDCSPG